MVGANEMSTFRDLLAWQRGMDLAESVYRLTVSFPESERFGLTAQMRRSAISVPSNIAEGAGRAHRREFINFLAIARGSLSELDTQLELAGRLGIAGSDHANATKRLLDETGRLLGGLLRSMRSTSAQP